MRRFAQPAIQAIRPTTRHSACDRVSVTGLFGVLTHRQMALKMRRVKRYDIRRKSKGMINAGKCEEVAVTMLWIFASGTTGSH